MRQLFYTLLISFASIVMSSGQEISFQFYDQKLSFPYDKKFWSVDMVSNSEEGLSQFVKRVSKTKYHALLESLLREKESLKLNDWLYIELLKKLSIEYSNEYSQAAYLWFLLGESGYKTELAYSIKSGVKEVYFYSYDQIHNFYHVGEKVCLTCGRSADRVQFLKFAKYQNGKYIGININELPTLLINDSIEKTIRVPRINLIEPHYFSYAVNKSLVNIYHDYPNFEIKKIVETPFSIQARPLLLKLDNFVHSFNDSIKVSYLMHFVSSLISYKEDKKSFNKDDKWMTPEEVLYYGTGDCEDHTSLLYSLIMQLTNLPMVIIDYPEIGHANLAVSINNLRTTPDFYYKGNPFYVCETTSMNNSFIDLGGYKKIESMKYEIVGELRVNPK